MENREPLAVASGDTLQFTRTTPGFSAADGWSLVYDLFLSDPAGDSQVVPTIQFTSTSQGESHAINVDAATTATWPEGEYVLTGYAVKGGERHQIYSAPMAVGPNLQTPPTPLDAPRKTFAQQMAETLQTALLTKAQGGDLSSSSVGGTAFSYMTWEELNKAHGYWVQVRRNEIARDRAKNGGATGTKIRPRFRVLSSGPVFGSNPFFGGN